MTLMGEAAMDDAAWAQGWAAEWAAGWNAHDLDRIMTHYAEEIVFRSRKAIPLAGAGEVVGKPALRAYWAAALDRQPDLRFTVEAVYGGHRTLVVAYVNHRGVRAAETLWFGEDGRAVMAAACHEDPRGG
ncbi:MAG: nuclear transport factor 2 family protein [Pseudomonadota bacterium]